MKRNILSIMLACLMIVSLLVLTGCKVDDLAVKVDENAANAENAVNNAASKADADVKAAAKKAADDLAAAQAKLEKLIKDGDAADTASLAAAVKDFNAAIAAIDEALTGADAALKAELVADFDEKIETATKMLQEATNTAIGKATEELEAAIAKGDAATAAQLSDAIAAVAGKLANLDAVVQETAIALDDLLKAELSAAIEAVADAAAKNLADAKAALTEAIAAGDAKVVADLTAAIEAAAEAAALADDALKAELTAAIESAVAALETKLTAALDAAKADLNAAIATKAEAEDLAAAIVEYKALVAAAESAAKAAAVADNEALETKLTKLVNDSVAALEASIKTVADDLADATAALNALIKTNADDITALEASRDALNDDVAALQAALDALSGDTEADFSSLTTYIDEQLADAVAALTAATIQLKDWNEASDVLYNAIMVARQDIMNKYVTYTYEVPQLKHDPETGKYSIEYNEFESTGRVVLINATTGTPSFYGNTTSTSDNVNSRFSKLYSNLARSVYFDPETKTSVLIENQAPVFQKLFLEVEYKLLRATSVDDVADILAEYDAAIDAVPTKAEAIESVLLTFVGEEHLANPVDAVVYDTATWGVLLQNVGNYITSYVKNNNYGWNSAYSVPVYKISDDGMSFTSTSETHYYYRELYADVIELYEALNARYLDLAGAADGEEILADMEELNKVDVVYDDTQYEDKVAALKVAYETWLATGNNANITDEIFGKKDEAGTVLNTFYGKVARIEALNTAEAEANALNTEIKNLIDAIAVTTVSDANTTKLATLTKAVEEWITTYFSAPYDVEKVAENKNWALLGHDDWAQAQKDYADAKAAFEANAKPYIDAVAKIGDINLFSGDEIDFAIAQYRKFQLGLTKYENIWADVTKDIEGAGATPYETYLMLLDKKTEYDALVDTASADFDAAYALIEKYVKAENPDLVTIYTTEFADMFKWFEKYACVVDGAYTFTNVNNNGNTEFKATEGYALENATVTKAMYDQYVALQAKVDALVKAKNEETAAVEALIDAIANVVIKGSFNAELKFVPVEGDSSFALAAAEKALAEWLSGAKAPEGFVAAQFAINPADPTYVVENADDLQNATTGDRAVYDALVAEALAIHNAILALDDKAVSADFADLADRNDYEVAIKAIRDAIKALETKNGEGNVVFDLAKLATGELAIYKYDAVATITAYHVAYGETVVDAAIEALLKDAVAAIDASADTEAVDAAVALAKAKYDATVDTADKYAAAVADVETTLASYAEALAASKDALAKIFNANVASIKAATTVEECNAGLKLATEKYDGVCAIAPEYVAQYAIINADADAKYADAAAKALALANLETALELGYDAVVGATASIPTLVETVIQTELPSVYLG